MEHQGQTGEILAELNPKFGTDWLELESRFSIIPPYRLPSCRLRNRARFSFVDINVIMVLSCLVVDLCCVCVCFRSSFSRFARQKFFTFLILKSA